MADISGYGIKRTAAQPKNTSGKDTGLLAPYLLSIENHSLGEWFKGSLVAMMKKEKLLLV